ncbi:hypothetical protein G6713_04965 [Polynucleobacter paneuropaeus]|nr:hypothetical protein G6713_04965 [Polynucleobacter paneuropaeus]
MSSNLFEQLPSDIDPIPKPTFRHRMFFNFLVISPSYYIAHISRSDKRKARNTNKVPDFHKVLEMYSLCGNVFDRTFDVWWAETGHKIIEAKSKEPTLLFKPDFTRSSKYNAEVLTLLIENKRRAHINNQNKVGFLKNKIRDTTLENRYSIVVEKYNISRHDRLVQKNGWLPNWLAAYHFRDSLVHDKKSRAFRNITKSFVMKEGFVEFIKDKSKRKDDSLIEIPRQEIVGLKADYNNKLSEKAKRYLSMLMSKNLSEARYISENAARGVFPSKQSIPCLKFDPTALEQVLYKDLNQTLNELLQLDNSFVTPIKRKKKAKDDYKELISKAFQEQEIKKMIESESQVKAEEMALEIAREMYRNSQVKKGLR